MKANGKRFFAILVCALMLLSSLIAFAENAGGTTPPNAGMAEDVTTRLKAKASEGKPQALVDRKSSTFWEPKKEGARLELTIPGGNAVSGMMIEWVSEPTRFIITEADASGNTIATRDQDDFFKSVEMFVEIQSNTAKILLELPATGHAISELYVYSAGELPASVHKWADPPSKVDLLVVVAHMGDEYLYMGGMLPYYNYVRGKTVHVLYMCNDSRQIKQEALAGLWSIGLRSHPTFVNFNNKKTTTLSEGLSNWNEESMKKALVAFIRRYRPEVVVTNAASGEAGDGARMATAEIVKYAVEAAGDSAVYPEFSETYGPVWSPKKLYRHLEEAGAIVMDWQTASEELDGATPLSVAKSGYDQYKSLTTTMDSTGAGDSSKFGLVYTLVGEDVEKNDLFENLELSVPLLTNTPEPVGNLDVFEPPTPTPTPEPTPSPTPSPTPVPQGFGLNGNLEPLRIFGICLAVAVGVTALGLGLKVFLSGGSTKKKKKKKSTGAKKSNGSKSGTTAKKKTSSSGTKTKKTPEPKDDETY